MKVTLKTPEPVKPNVVLELTEFEARVLCRLAGRVGGPLGTAREFTGRLYVELSKLGYHADPMYSGKAVPAITSGTIKFAEES